jgi:hypothetical protein
MGREKWQKYAISGKEYFRLTDPYELRFELWDGVITLKSGNPVVWLERNPLKEPDPENALMVISDLTEEDVDKIAAFVASLRGQ